MSSDIVLAIVVVSALTFDFTNGFHDTANVVATSISTRALSPRLAVSIAAVLNFAGAFISLKVAATIGQGFVATHAVTTTVLLSALVGAITWNLITWWLGLPTSSSHAMIGGLVGGVIAASGFSAISGHGVLVKLVVPAVVAPLGACLASRLAIAAVYRTVGHMRPGPVGNGFRLGQVVSGSLLALAHGTNDAQKTMGVITLALIAHGSLSASHFHVPAWVVVASAAAIAGGTFSGGWRIIRTLGGRIIRMDPAQGFVAETVGTAVILAASAGGYPLSTTHVITGGVVGAGAGKRLSAVRWGVASDIALAWVLTLPVTALIAAAVYAVVQLFGAGDLGPILLGCVEVAGIAALFTLRARQTRPQPLAARQS
jgi:PiT family inorganic phosphate transporter